MWLRQIARPYIRYIQQTTVCHTGQEWHTHAVTQDQQPGLAQRAGCQKQMAPSAANSPIRWAVTSQAFTRWRQQSEVELIWWIALLLIYRSQKDERLSWPSWLACSGWLTHIVVTRRLQAEHSSPTEDRRSANCATQPTTFLSFFLACILRSVWHHM